MGAVISQNHQISLKPRATKAFTITELAIVLGIVGLILGGIWTAAASVYQQQRNNKFVKDLFVISENIRVFYQDGRAQAASGWGGIADFPARYKAGLYPADFFENVTINAWGGWGTTTQGYSFWDSYEAGSAYGLSGASGNYYEIDIDNMGNQSTCIEVLKYFSGLERVVDITTNLNGWGPIQGGNVSGILTLPHPLLASDLVGACNSDPYGFIWIIFSV